MEAGRPIRTLSPPSLPGYRLGFTGFRANCPGCPGQKHRFPGDCHCPHLGLPVQSERGIDSRPAGWMAPTSCLADLGCLPGLLSDSTISPGHPGTHGTSRKNHVRQEQAHATGADGNSSSHAHNGALGVIHGLWCSGAGPELWQSRSPGRF